MADPQDRVDIPGVGPAPGTGAEEPAMRREQRSWLGIHFRCCSVYGRLYRRSGQREYRGHCPRCGAAISVPIGPGGTNMRFFEAE